MGTRRTTTALAAAVVALPLAVLAPSAGAAVQGQEAARPVCTEDVPYASHLRDRSDVPPVHAAAVDCAAFLGITKGTPIDRWSVGFVPAASVTRGAMASFVARTLRAAGVVLPAPSDQRFSDLDGSPHDEAVHQLRAAGVVGGVGDNAYAPGTPVTRGQTASLLLRAAAYGRGVHPATLEREDAPFTDVDSSVHERAIAGAHALGLVEGVTETSYAPGADTTRAQMASLLIRTLESEAQRVQSCPNDENDYTVFPPVSWTANRGTTLPPCSAFDPEPFEVDPGTDDTRHLAVFVHDEPAPWEMLLTPAPGHGEVVDREQLLQLGPRRAAIQQRTATGNGLHPEGARSTLWFVDRGDHTLVGETHDVPGHDYATTQAVLARMLLSLELPEPDRMAFSSPETVDTAPSDGGGLGLVDVRTGRHDGFDRVVLQLDGDGTVGWRVDYTDDPRHQGSGHPVDVAGTTALQVVVRGVGYPESTGVPYYEGGKRLAGPGSAIEEVVVGSQFEGQRQAFVGVREALPFRVFRLNDPQRVVIDVAHSAGG